MGVMTAEITASKQPGRRGRPFPKGRSGNPRGRPLGARNAATLIAEKLLDGEAERLTRKAVEMALAGDTTALRICIDRILPPRRDRLVRFKLPELGSADGAMKALAAITMAVAQGDLTPGETAELSRLVEAYVKAIEASDFEQRIKALECAATSGHTPLRCI